MPILQLFGNDTQVTWGLPIHDGAAVATGATIASQDNQSVTFTAPPPLGAVVFIDWNPPSSLASAGQQPVDVLSGIGVARQVAAGASSASVTLSPQCRRVSLFAADAAIRYAIGVGAQTASTTSHYISSGERLDVDVPPGATVAAIRAGGSDGTLFVSELT